MPVSYSCMEALKGFPGYTWNSSSQKTIRVTVNVSTLDVDHGQLLT